MTVLWLLVLVAVDGGWTLVSGRGGLFTNHWAVRIMGGPERADIIAAKHGYRNLGQIGSLEDHYHFHHRRGVRRAAYSLKGPHSFIQMDPQVDWAQQQVGKPRVKRYAPSDPDSIHFNDPKWANMWYIHCNDKSNHCRSEMNILAAWQRGYTGRNVVVTILDDGIERNHPIWFRTTEALSNKGYKSIQESSQECIQCAEGFLQQEWQCLQTCTPGHYSAEAAGLPHKICHKCEKNCLNCSGPGTTCTKCKAGYSLFRRTCIVKASCNNAEDVFCEMVKFNRLCEKKFYRQFCCRTCLMNG